MANVKLLGWFELFSETEVVVMSGMLGRMTSLEASKDSAEKLRFPGADVDTCWCWWRSVEVCCCPILWGSPANDAILCDRRGPCADWLKATVETGNVCLPQLFPVGTILATDAPWGEIPEIKALTLKFCSVIISSCDWHTFIFPCDSWELSALDLFTKPGSFVPIKCSALRLFEAELVFPSNEALLCELLFVFWDLELVFEDALFAVALFFVLPLPRFFEVTFEVFCCSIAPSLCDSFKRDTPFWMGELVTWKLPICEAAIWAEFACWVKMLLDAGKTEGGKGNMVLAFWTILGVFITVGWTFKTAVLLFPIEGFASGTAFTRFTAEFDIPGCSVTFIIAATLCWENPAWEGCKACDELIGMLTVCKACGVEELAKSLVAWGLTLWWELDK